MLVYVLHFWLQPVKSFNEQEERAGTETEQHDGYARGNASKGAGGRATVVAASIGHRGVMTLPDVLAPCGSSFNRISHQLPLKIARHVHQLMMSLVYFGRRR